MLVLTLCGLAAPRAASAQDTRAVDVIEVIGLLDPVLVDFVHGSLEEAEDRRAAALVVQLDSAGAVVSREDIIELAAEIEDASVPVAVWLGPGRAVALEDALRLVLAADVVGMAPGSRVGKAGDIPGAPPALQDEVGRDRAEELGVVDVDAPTLGDLIVGIEGVETRVVRRDGQPRREPITPVRFTKLGLLPRLMHTVASPSVAYLLLLAGLLLVVLELFTAGVGVAGAVAAGCLLLGGYGLAVLPTRPLGLALLLLATFGFAVDVQTGVPRAWSVIGTVALVLGSLWLYDGLTLPLLTLLGGIVGALLLAVAGTPSLVRARFSTPTIGREAMIGQRGEAVQDVRPEGVVRVRSALWRARANRATPIAQGEAVRVVGIDGLLLEVEPDRDNEQSARESSPWRPDQHER